MIECLWNWGIERTKEILNAFSWALHTAGNILINLINKIAAWLK